MEHTHENTHLIYTQEQDMENNEIKLDELYDKTNDYLITEEELKYIHPDLDNKISFSNNELRYHDNSSKWSRNFHWWYRKFHQYCSWLLIGHKGKTLHPTTIKVTTSQLDGGSNSHVFTDIKLFAYIKPVQFNVQILNGITLQ